MAHTVHCRQGLKRKPGLALCLHLGHAVMLGLPDLLMQGIFSLHCPAPTSSNRSTQWTQWYGTGTKQYYSALH
mgnify:CR=1 FL=1